MALVPIKKDLWFFETPKTHVPVGPSISVPVSKDGVLIDIPVNLMKAGETDGDKFKGAEKIANAKAAIEAATLAEKALETVKEKLKVEKEQTESLSKEVMVLEKALGDAKTKEAKAEKKK